MKRLALILALLASPALAQSPPTLNAASQEKFIATLAEISMPAKSYNQIMQVWQALIQQQQAEEAHKAADEAKYPKPTTTPKEKE